MNVGLELITTNLNTDLVSIVMFLLILGAIIFGAKDFKLAVIMFLVGSAVTFIVVYNNGGNWVIPLSAMMISLVVLAFSLYFISKTSYNSGGMA